MRTPTLVIDMTYKTLLSRVTSVYMRDQELGREINWHANHYTLSNPPARSQGGTWLPFLLNLISRNHSIQICPYMILKNHYILVSS